MKPLHSQNAVSFSSANNIRHLDMISSIRLLALLSFWKRTQTYNQRTSRCRRNISNRLHCVKFKTEALTLSYFITSWRFKALQHYFLPLALIFVEISFAHAVFLYTEVLHLIISATWRSPPFPCRPAALNFVSVMDRYVSAMRSRTEYFNNIQ